MALVWTLPREDGHAPSRFRAVDLAAPSGAGRSWRDDVAASLADPGTRDLTWVHVHPDAMPEIAALLAAAGLPAHLAAQLGGEHHLASLVLGSAGVVVALALLRFEAATVDVEVDRVTLLCVPGLVVTVAPGDAVAHELARDLRPGAARRGPLGVLRDAAATAARCAVDVEQGVADAVADVERVVFGDTGQGPTREIYRLKRELAEARRALAPMASRLAALGDEELPAALGQVSRTSLHRVTATLRRAAEQVDGEDRLLGDLLTAQLALVQVRQNADMRRMSAWAALFAVPALIAGVYGMNFRHMPELDWTFGYPLALAVMASVVLTLHRLFRRSGWL